MSHTNYQKYVVWEERIEIFIFWEMCKHKEYLHGHLLLGYGLNQMFWISEKKKYLKNAMSLAED